MNPDQPPSYDEVTRRNGLNGIRITIPVVYDPHEATSQLHQYLCPIHQQQWCHSSQHHYHAIYDNRNYFAVAELHQSNQYNGGSTGIAGGAYTTHFFASLHQQEEHRVVEDYEVFHNSHSTHAGSHFYPDVRFYENFVNQTGSAADYVVPVAEPQARGPGRHSAPSPMWVPPRTSWDDDYSDNDDYLIPVQSPIMYHDDESVASFSTPVSPTRMMQEVEITDDADYTDDVDFAEDVEITEDEDDNGQE